MKIDPVKQIGTFIKVFPEQKALDQLITQIDIQDIKLGGEKPEDDNKLYYLA